MQNKILPGMGALVLLVGAAAFIGGRLLNQRADGVGLGAPFEGDFTIDDHGLGTEKRRPSGCGRVVV